MCNIPTIDTPSIDPLQKFLRSSSTKLKVKTLNNLMKSQLVD